MKTEQATREDVEAALWRWSGWKADQRNVDAVLDVVDGYVQRKVMASGIAATRQPEPKTVETQLQGAVETAAVRPVEPLRHVPVDSLPLATYQDAQGGLWVRLATLDVVIETTERTRVCSKCGGVKPISRFNRDRNSRAGRKMQCKDCENAARRAHRARVARESEALTNKV